MNNIYMLGKIVFVLMLGYSFPLSMTGQVTGKWKTIDDTDGKEKSIIEVYEHQGKLHGRVLELLDPSAIKTCGKCPEPLKDQPLVGMVIMKDLTKTKTGGTDGNIIDPATGKNYSCLIELVSEDKLKLRGYIGLPAFGRTQYWYRVN